MQYLSKTAQPFTLAKGSWRHLQLGQWLLLGAALAFCPAMAPAAETSAAAASALKVLTAPWADANTPSGAAHPEGAHSGASITVQKGESIDAVIRRGLPGLILNDEFLRQALAKANPRIFPKGRTYPVKPGTVLMLPSHEALRQQILSQYPQTAALFQASAEQTDASDVPAGPDKRRWVRFP